MGARFGKRLTALSRMLMPCTKPPSLDAGKTTAKSRFIAHLGRAHDKLSQTIAACYKWLCIGMEIQRPRYMGQLESKKGNGLVVVRYHVVPRHDDNGILVVGVHDFLLDPSLMGTRRIVASQLLKMASNAAYPQVSVFAPHTETIYSPHSPDNGLQRRLPGW